MTQAVHHAPVVATEKSKVDVDGAQPSCAVWNALSGVGDLGLRVIEDAAKCFIAVIHFHYYASNRERKLKRWEKAMSMELASWAVRPLAELCTEYEKLIMMTRPYQQ